MVGFCLLDCLVWSAGIRALLFLLYLDCPRRLRLNQWGLRLLVHKYKNLRVPSISRVLVDTRCTCEVAAPCNCDVASTVYDREGIAALQVAGDREGIYAFQNAFTVNDREGIVHHAWYLWSWLEAGC